MLATQLRILRVFGLSAAEVSGILRAAQEDGCPGLRLLEKDGEYAVCVQASAPTQAMATSYCDKWVQKLALRFDAALYGVGQITLAGSALSALLQKRRLLVAADEQTGRLIGALLRPLPHSEAAFDFGTQTYANPAAAKKIITPAAVLKKYPGDVLQAAAARAQTALQVGGADYALVYMPATVGQAPFALLCDKRGAAACAVSPELSEANIANQLLDLARRKALGLKYSASTVSFRPGRETPLLLVSQEGQFPGDMLPIENLPPREHGWGGLFGTEVTESDTTREPVAEPLDEDLADHLGQTLPPQADAGAQGDEDEDEEDTTEFATIKDYGPPPRLQTAAGQDFAQEQEPEQGQESAAAAALRRFTAARPAGAIRFETPQESTVPPAAEPTPEPAAQGASAAAAARRRRAGEQQNPPHSLLDDEIPAFDTDRPAQTAAFARANPREPDAPATEQNFRDAARNLFDAGDPADVVNPIKNKSLAMIERSERRQQRTLRIFGCALLLLVLAGAGGLYWFFHTDLGAKPAPRGYGTAAFDEKAGAYLTKALENEKDTAGYLAFPGAEGGLVYTAAHTDQKAAFGGALAAATAESAAPRLVGENRLGSAAPGNTLLDCGGTALAGMADAETLKQNSGFTLYTPQQTYRYKVLAVYYWDPAETGSGAFDLENAADLSGYYSYLSFVWGIHTRSLFDTGVDVPDDSSFLTLLSDAGSDGVKICVTGRLITGNEDAQLTPSAIRTSSDPLLTAAQYTATGKQMPDVAGLLSNTIQWYAARETAKETAAGANDPQATAQPQSDSLGNVVNDLQNMTDSILSSTDKLMAGLTDIANKGSSTVETDIKQGAEGSLPDQNLTIDSVTGGSSGSSSSSGSSGSSSDQSSSGSSGGSSSSGGTGGTAETINVTMNGTQQTMDLVTCLAMVAQNELGPNAPLEAYKAQCVAAHCWILSQGGYPSVLGATPGQTALDAANAVSRVLVTYNGSVCFTPYFASASTGTASAKDVWGSERAYLQPVDSPYDQSVASNWNTNGNTSGSARFSADALRQVVQDKLSIDLSGVDKNNWFKILSTNQYGWVSQMQIGPDGGQNTTCSGRWFRETLTAGKSVDGRSLRSQCFTFTYNADLDCFIFDVYGYGHGCGMSQWGAIGYARNGWSYDAILTHYYSGTTLTTY